MARIYKPKLTETKLPEDSKKVSTAEGSKDPSGVEMFSSIASGLSDIVSHGFDNINSVNGDMQYNTLKAMSNFDYAPGGTRELLEAYQSRPAIKTDYNFKDVGGQTWGQIIAGSFEDSLSGFSAGMSTGNPYITAALTAAGGISGLATGWIGRNKAKKVAADLNMRGGITKQQDIAKLNNAAYNSDVMGLNFARDGGLLNTHGIDWSNGMTYFNAGGSHEENPMGGILQGFDSMGNPNVVEEGEVKYTNSDNEDYIYSAKNKLGQKYQRDNDLDKKYIGYSFADAAKSLSKESEERPNDPISKRTQEDNMARLASAQDEYNLDKAKRKLKRGIDNLDQEDLMYLAEALGAMQEQPQQETAGIISDAEALDMQDVQQNNTFAEGGWLNWLEAAAPLGAAIQVYDDALGRTNKNDFSPYDSYLTQLTGIRDVGVSPIGGYKVYRRPDTTYAANLMRSQSANNIRNLSNLSGGNRGTAYTGILTNANNFRSSLGDYLLQADKEARDAELAYAQYNTGIREKEVANQLAAQQANQNKDLAISRGLLDYGKSIQDIIDANDEAKGYNRGMLGDLISKYAKTLRAFRDRDAFIDSGAAPAGAENSFYGYSGSRKKSRKNKKDDEED